MSWRADLSAAELREIFDRDIAPTLTAGGAAELHPSVVFVGAQPGAGKSRAIATVRDERPGTVPIIGDDFRRFHPDYRDLMRTEPLAMPHVTAQASGAWVGMAADHLRSQRRSVILETTMRQLPVVEATAAAFRAQEYRVEAYVLAVPGAVSTLGTVTRYLGEAAGNDQNRWTPSAAHEAAYEAMPHTVEQLAARGLVDRVTVSTRAQNVLYDRAVTADTAAAVSVEARRAVEAGRSSVAMTSREGREWVRQYVVAAPRVSRLAEAAEDLRETMRRLAAAGPEIIRHTHEPALRAAAREAVADAEISARPRSAHSIPSGTARLSVAETGDGDGLPVLLIHAGVTDLRSWDPLVERLGAETRCIRYDARGYGETVYEEEDGWSPVDDAVAVLDALRVDSSIVIGCSMGGGTAIDLALAHPERVAALVLIASAVSGAPEPELEPAVAELDRAIDAADERGDLDEVNRLEAHLWLDGPGHDGRVTGVTRELLLEMNGRALASPEPGDPAAVPGAFSRLDDISVPTLILVGDLDLAHIRENARHAAEVIPRARLIELRDVAHLPHMEGDSATFDAIAGFIGGTGR